MASKNQKEKKYLKTKITQTIEIHYYYNCKYSISNYDSNIRNILASWISQ